MPHETQEPAKNSYNHLLAALSPETHGRLAPFFEHVPLDLRQTLHTQNQPITHVYFPTQGVMSLLKLTPGADPIEVATIGNEGFVGVPVLLGVESAPEHVFCQVPGAALRMPARAFAEALQASPELSRVMLRYTQALITLIAQSSACNRLHNVEERAARWLLMTHDRVHADEFPLTQEFLAQMLGVRRQAVNVAAGILNRAGLISYVRGVIRILDRKGLEGAACECYASIQQEFARLVG